MSTAPTLHDFVKGKDGIERCSICEQTRMKKGMAFPRHSACTPDAQRIPLFEAELQDLLVPMEGNDDGSIIERQRDQGRYAGSRSGHATFERRAARLFR